MNSLGEAAKIDKTQVQGKENATGYQPGNNQWDLCTSQANIKKDEARDRVCYRSQQLINNLVDDGLQPGKGLPYSI